MKILKALFFVFCAFCAFVVIINLIVVLSTKKNIVLLDNKTFDADFVLILGAAVWQNRRPSFILEDRLLTGIDVFKFGVVDFVLLSGDHGKQNYDEVTVMKNFVVEKGIGEKYIVLDTKGFSTYDSCYNAKNTFKAKKIIIITQKYHLYRALYIAKSLGLEARGIASDRRKLRGSFIRNFREVFARVKDFFVCTIKPAPNINVDQSQ